MAQSQSAVAEAEAVFGGVDILFCCESEALVGALEELSSPSTQSLVREQFETNFYSPVNSIKAVLPSMRRKGGGHIVVLSSVSNQLGTPGLSAPCSAGWALDGFCASLAYEIAPFNIKLTILQPNLEVTLLTSKIVAAPMLEAYHPAHTPAPLSPGFVGAMLARIEGDGDDKGSGKRFMGGETERLYPRLTPGMKEALLEETAHAVCAIAGHENPPAGHIGRHEGVASVKEKLKTVNEELEDFLRVSCGVDIDDGGAVGEVDGSGSANDGGP